MAKLPMGLQPWCNELQGVSQEMNETLAPWLGRIDRALGTGCVSGSSTTGEVDGYDGIDRFGSLDRLMISDWLLLQDYPDEFLRRFTDRELSYYQYALISPTDSTQIVALFDAGPDQIGLPRLAHIALFVVIARRAMRTGCQFLWGILQDPSTTLYEDTGPDAIMRLLQSRSAQCVDEAARQRWAEVLKSADFYADVWLIGDSDSRAQGGKAVHITQVASEESDFLILQVSGQANSLQLACPAPSVCVSVLRNPYQVTHTPTTGADFLDCRFSIDGRRLLVLKAGGVQIHNINSGKSTERQAEPMTIDHPDDEFILGVQSAKHRSFLLTTTQRQLRLRGRSKYIPFNLPAIWQAPDGSAPVRECWATRKVLYFVDGTSVLWRLPYSQTGSQPEEILQGVVATMMIDGSMRCWVAEGNALVEYRIFQVNQDPREHYQYQWPDELEAGLIQSGEAPLYVANNQRNQSCVGIFYQGALYYQISAARSLEFSTLPDGITFSAIATLDDGLWALGVDKFHHDLIGFNPVTQTSKVFLSSPFEIDSVWTSINAPRVACRTGLNTGFVADLETCSVLLEFGDA